MRRSRPTFAAGCAALAVCAAGAVGACITPLDDEFTRPPPGPAPDDGDDAAVATGCAVFGGQPGIAGVSGALHSVAVDDGGRGSLWVSDRVDLPDGGATIGAAIGVPGGAAADCTGGSAQLEGAAFDPSPLSPDGFVASGDLAATPAGLAAYYALYTADSTMPFGIRLLGYGVALQDAGSGRFAPTGELLWTADRPGYGSSALVVGTSIYVHGCKSNEPLTDDCYVARADAASIASPAAYTYWSGTGWSSSPDDAVPVARAAGAVSVRPDPSGKPRFLMTYVPPFGQSLMARSAIAPEGPWSSPVELARCALDPTIPGVYCGGGEQHPQLSAPSGQLVMSYDDETLSPDAGINVHGFWPKLVSLAVPAALP
jgi:hypothetical protein